MEYLIGLALFERQWTFDFGALDVHDDVIRPDIVQGTDMRMIQRCDGAGFPLKASLNVAAEVLMATVRSSRVSRAFHAWPMPPLPMAETIS